MLCFRGLEKFSITGELSAERMSASDVFPFRERDGDSLRGSDVPVMMLPGFGVVGIVTEPAKMGIDWIGETSGDTIGAVLGAAVGLL